MREIVWKKVKKRKKGEKKGIHKLIWFVKNINLWKISGIIVKRGVFFQISLKGSWKSPKKYTHYEYTVNCNRQIRRCTLYSLGQIIYPFFKDIYLRAPDPCSMTKNKHYKKKFHVPSIIPSAWNKNRTLRKNWKINIFHVLFVNCMKWVRLGNLWLLYFFVGLVIMCKMT